MIQVLKLKKKTNKKKRVWDIRAFESINAKQKNALTLPKKRAIPAFAKALGQPQKAQEQAKYAYLGVFFFLAI